MTNKIAILSLLGCLLAGCAALEQGRARVHDGVIENSSLGFSGFTYEIPEGFELVDPAVKDPAECTEIQKLAIQISDVSTSCHPSGNETFYESFLMFSDNAAFLLVTVEYDRLSAEGGPWEENDGIDPQRQLLPFYNISDSRRARLSGSRTEAQFTTGQAYEKKGWYYAKPKAGRMPFSYEACKVSGVNRDSYILMGFALPEHEDILSIQMQKMVGGFNF